MGWILIEKFNVKIRSSQRRRKNGEPKVQYYKFVAVEGWGMEESVFSLSVQSLGYIIVFFNLPKLCISLIH